MLSPYEPQTLAFLVPTAVYAAGFVASAWKADKTRRAVWNNAAWVFLGALASVVIVSVLALPETILAVLYCVWVAIMGGLAVFVAAAVWDLGRLVVAFAMRRIAALRDGNADAPTA